MAASARDDDFDEYDKPGAERSRRRRGADEEMDSDLEGDLLEEDWLSSKKNPSELSDEELNDDLLQSDEEDQNNGGEAVSLNATLNLTSSYVFEGEDLGEGGGHAEEKGYEVTEGGEENCKAGEFAVEEGGGMEYATGQNEETYEDEVLELDINEPLDDEFQVSDYGTEAEEQQGDQQEVPQVEEGEQEEEEEKVEDRGDLQVTESEELEPEAEGEHEADVREESDEDEEEEESGRLRFKTERKDVTVVRLADAASKRRNIPETLELTEEAKADLLEFEEKERQKRQGRFGGRGRGGGSGGGRGRGGGGRGGPPMFRSGDFRHNGGGGRGKINEQRPPLMQMNLGMQPRLIQTHHSSRPAGPRGGPGLFPAPLGPLSQQPLQMLMHNRSPGPPPKQQQQQQQELHGPRGLNTPPLPAHSHSGPQHQPKNIHINPHFRGPASSAGQVPLMPPAQNQPRPNVSPQRFPGPAEFQPHLQGNFGQPQRPPPPEPWRGPPPHHHQEREPFFGEPRFPGQHVFDLPGPPPLINNILPLANQGPMPFPQLGGLSGPSGPGGPGFGPLGIGQGQGPPPGGGGGGGLFQNLPPQHGPSSPGPRGFMGHRQQPFPPQQQQQQPQGGPPFSPQHMPFGMQVRQRGIMQPHSQPQHHDPPPSHHPLHHQQHRQDLPMQGHPLPPHNQHHQRQPADQHPIMHLSHSQFRQPLQGGPRQMQQPRPQNSQQQQQQQRNNLGRMRMSSPPALQQLHTPPHRNSNLRELPIATGNAERPSQHAGLSRPVLRSPQDARAGLGAAGGGGVGRGRGAAKTQQPPPAAVRAKKEEEPAAQPSTATPDPDEDEETRQYRLKIEEQKRLREEILKRKELRRQMQAGARKKELMERQGQSQNQTQNQVQSSQPGPQLQPPSQQVPSLASNGAPQTPTPGPCLPHPNAKPRPELQVPGQPAQWQQQQQQQQQRKSISAPSPQRPTPPFHNNPQSGPGGPSEAQMQALRPGGKRTVMQRSNSAGSPQVPQKVRVVKRLGEPGPNLNTPSQQQQQQQHQPQLQQLQQHQQHLPGRPVPQQRLGNVRKITVASDGTRQQLDASSGPTNQVVVPVRGRGRGGPAGRGGNRIMTQQARQNPKTPELQPCTVCIGGLSSNTTEKQIKNLLNSIGPIQMLKMIPQQRKAIAKFTNHQHALSFQHSFHRHMIDLSNIDVSLIDD